MASCFKQAGPHEELCLLALPLFYRLILAAKTACRGDKSGFG